MSGRCEGKWVGTIHTQNKRRESYRQRETEDNKRLKLRNKLRLVRGSLLRDYYSTLDRELSRSESALRSGVER